MTDRVLEYYQTPVPPDFETHMIEETGLNELQKKIVRSFRTFTGDTSFYASAAGLPLKRFNAISARIHIRMIDELFRLAIIGWRAEQSRK